MSVYEKPVIVIEEERAEGIFMSSGGGDVTIRSGDGYAYVNPSVFGSNKGALVITNESYAGKNGSVTLRVSGFLGVHSSTLTFAGTTYNISNGYVTIYITGIVVNQSYPIEIYTGNVSVYSTNSVDEGGGDVYVEIVG